MVLKDTHHKAASDNNVMLLVSLAILVLMLAMSAIFMRAYTQVRDVADRAAVSDAEKFINSVVQYRNFYAQMIVPRAGALGATFTHDYLSQNNALPLPATFVRDFGDFVSRDQVIKVRMYSDLPFPWRIADGTSVQDGFEQEAMIQARQNPEQDYWQIEEREEGRVLRYAKPDVLQTACVACHNTYVGTPKTDWKVGDVRGVFELSRPLIDTETVLKESFKETAIWLALLGMVVLALLLVAFSRLRRALQISYEGMTVAQDARDALSEQMIEKVTLHEALQREEQKMLAIFRAVADAIIVIDRKGVIQQVNDAVLNIFKYEPEDLVGQNISILVPEPHASAHDGYLDRFIETKQAHIIGYTRQLQGLRKDGSLVDIDLSVNEVNVGGEILFAGVVRDVTLRLETELALKVARDRAIESVKMKSHFLTNISHELRTPLNGIMGMSQLLAEDLLDAQDKDQARIIQTSAQQLLAIVDDVLDFSSMESAKFTLAPSPFYVQSWLFDSLAVHLQAAQLKGIELSATIGEGLPEKLIADSARLSQIVNNLVSNAIKFTREGSVRIKLDKMDCVDDKLTLNITVQDTGIGISDDAIGRLFQAFSQVDGSTTRAYGGAGLGLVISRQLALLMGGDIKVNSVLGQGSTFVVTVILSVSGAERLTLQERILTNAVVRHKDTLLTDTTNSSYTVASSTSADLAFDMVTSMKILLIEDNVVNQKVAMALLKRMGYSVEVANNGQEGLDRLNAETFDAVLMDCQMPVMDGYEASRQIRLREAGTEQHLPIIALTAHAMKGDAEKCYESGMDDYLTKPINHGLLKERLEYWQNWLTARKKA
jgi:PAS domain S-box-containing protein